MSSSNIQIYNTKPSVNEFVLVTFNEKTETHFKGRFSEYPYEIIMTLSNASKKKRITSWKNIVPLGKAIVARVEDNSDTIMEVSLLYIYKDEKKESKEDQFKKLLEPFNKNKQLVSIFIQLSCSFPIKSEDLWNTIIYRIDERRREEYEDEDIKDFPTLLDYCIDKEDYIKSAFESYPEIYNKFKESLDKITELKEYKIISKVQIISTGGIQNTISLLKEAFDKISYNYSLKYETASIMTFETIGGTEDDHNNLVEFIKEEGSKLNPKTFIKYEQPPIRI